MKKLVLVCAFALTTLGACVQSKAYVDPAYATARAATLSPDVKGMAVQLDVSFKRNGKEMPKMKKQITKFMSTALTDTGFKVTDAKDAPKLTIVADNIANMQEAAGKGFGAGLTFGLNGTTVSDGYDITYRLDRGGEVIEKNYDHVIQTTIGNEAAPLANVKPSASLQAAFDQVLKDTLTQFFLDVSAANAPKAEAAPELASS